MVIHVEILETLTAFGVVNLEGLWMVMMAMMMLVMMLVMMLGLVMVLGLVVMALLHVRRIMTGANLVALTKLRLALRGRLRGLLLAARMGTLIIVVISRLGLMGSHARGQRLLDLASNVALDLVHQIRMTGVQSRVVRLLHG